VSRDASSRIEERVKAARVSEAQEGRDALLAEESECETDGKK